jgi:hypothetical protein
MQSLIPAQKDYFYIESIQYRYGIVIVTYIQYVTLVEANSSFVQCCGSGMFIPDPANEFCHPGSEARV